ncbi:hypothetical protein OAF64_03180 [Crocinitomicaceae bacterium]|jgi:hypothetical protein|nr:hypothetical protein [Crocinitomicaceae bacterium]
MKAITLGLLNLLLTIPITAQQISQIGSDFENCGGTPAYGLYDYSQSSMLYLAAELEAVGISAGNSITAIEFQFNSWDNGYELDNQTIKMAHITESSLPDPGSPDYSSLSVSNNTTVKNEFDFRGFSGITWGQFDFDTPFIWDGTSNILITWENRDGSWSSGFGWLEGRNISNRCHIWFKDDNYPTESSSTDRDLPNIKIHTTFNPLPITLSAFTGELLKNNDEVSIKLDWTTASEKDNDYFTVWRSFDGQNWAEISNLIGAGNSNNEIKYQYIDRNISPQRILHETIYYRLSQTDYDGTAEYFQIIPIELKSEKTHVVKRMNAMGQEVLRSYRGLVIETWNNGTTTKTIW